MREFDVTVIRQILTERFDWYRIWIWHWFSIEESEPIMEFLDGIERPCFGHGLDVKRSVI